MIQHTDTALDGSKLCNFSKATLKTDPEICGCKITVIWQIAIHQLLNHLLTLAKNFEVHTPHHALGLQR